MYCFPSACLVSGAGVRSRRLGGGGEKVEYSLYALGMPRRALRHEDIRLTYAPRWRGNLLSRGREGEEKGRHSKAALSGTDEE